MLWLKDLYLGEKAARDARGLIRAAERGKKGKKDQCYLVTLSAYPHAQLDLMSIKESRRAVERGESLKVLGLASGKGEAVSLVEKMLQDCLRKSGGPDMKAFFGKYSLVSWREVHLS